MGEEDVDHATKEKEAAKAMAELLAQEEKAGGAKVRSTYPQRAPVQQ